MKNQDLSNIQLILVHICKIKRDYQRVGAYSMVVYVTQIPLSNESFSQKKSNQKT
ncbi:hypothetical protein pb186bvf_015799 [Paramecium bursaria]